jgi:hypothetical protein
MQLLLALLFLVTAQAPIPRPEHPRPDFQRDEWVNLNGEWEFRFDPADQGVKEQWFAKGNFDRRIVVPFCWESKLSGIQNLDKNNKVGWYRRTIQVPPQWQGKGAWLRFGAVDYEATVWVNGKEVGKHVGGYTPFDIDLSEHVKPGESATVVVRAFDPTDPFLPTGKQVGWYTTASGIWQTVWLEARPKAFIDDFKVTTTNNEGRWRVSVDVSLKDAGWADRLEVLIGDARHVIPADQRTNREESWKGGRLDVEIPAPRLWTPWSPYLYPLTLVLTTPDGRRDVVKSYFGVRTISRGKFGDLQHESILLNGSPIYLRGALDQSFNPDGIYTAPSEEFLVRELQMAKNVGLNFLRIHIKPEEPIRLFHADRMGVLIMQDLPNSWRHAERSRTAWEQTFHETYRRSKNHPSIFSWCLFNETWGLTNGDYHNFKKEPETQQWVAKMFDMAKATDPTRLIEDNSPCHYDHVKTDIHSWHFYIDNDAEATKHIEDVVKNTFPGSSHNCAPGWKQGTEPLINSEYGSVSAGGGDRDVSWGVRHLTTQLRRHSKIQGYVYTELTDIEWEHNGFANYDRTPKEFGYDAWNPGMTLAHLQGADFVGLKESGAIKTSANSVTVRPFVSHFDPATRPTRIRLWIRGSNERGEFGEFPGAEVAVQAKLFDVVEQPAVTLAIPSGAKAFVGAIAVDLIDAAGRRIAANYTNLVYPSVKPSLPKAEWLDQQRRTLAVRFQPTGFAANAFKGARTRTGKFAATGAGEVEYRVAVPQALRGRVAQIDFTAEVASRAGSAKVDWPSRPNSQDYPQTDVRKHPSRLALTINGAPATWGLADVPVIQAGVLPDDPADARGVLSHVRHLDPGAYGYRLVANAPPAPLGDFVSVKLAADNGLSLYDGTTGRYPLAPTLTFRLAEAGPTDADPATWYPEATTVDHLASTLKPILAHGAEWRFVTEAPPRSWNQPDFDDSKWKSGKGGFGAQGTPGIKLNSDWSTPDIWMRATFDLPADVNQIEAQLFHDENTEVFVNGRQLFRRRGYVTEYQEVPLTDEQRKLFKPGKNVVAVHCHQTGGGQGIDLQFFGSK